MKRSELYLSLFLVPLDYLAIVLAGLAAYYIRYADFFQSMRPVIFNLNLEVYLRSLFTIAFVWLLIFAWAGLYTINSGRKMTKEIYRVILACSTGFVLIVFFIFVRRELFDSRFIILAGYFLSIIFIILGRGIVRLVEQAMFRNGIGVRKVAIIGSSRTAEVLIKEFSGKKASGYEVVKRLWDFNLETEQELREFIKTKEVDEIIQSDPNLSKAETLRLFDFADENHLAFKYAADLLGTKVLKTEVVEISGIPIVEVKRTPLDGWGRIAKRIFDIFFSCLFMIILSPVFLITALIIKLDSSGPLFYLDYRSGQSNRRFLFYKFRSMLAHLCDGEGPSATEEGNKILMELESNLKANTRNAEPLHKIKNDPRVTRVGRFIRRWSIDELPQLYNVLKGDISLVGPRPHMTMETAKYETHHKKVLTIKPGITGLAQISGRSDLSFEEEVKLDTYYIENWSMILDFSILVRTPWAVVRSRKVE